MSPFWLVRMAQWLRNPPSKKRVYLVGVVLALCVLIVLLEYALGLDLEAPSGFSRRPTIELK